MVNMFKALYRAIFFAAPKVGDIFVFDEDVDPFEDKRHRVEVLEIKSGWVRYKWLEGSMWQDERMKVSMFNSCYIKVLQ